MATKISAISAKIRPAANRMGIASIIIENQ